MIGQLLLKKSGAALIAIVLGYGSNYLFYIITSRTLDKEVSGTLYLIISIVMFLSLISRFGLDRFALKFTAQYVDDNPKIAFTYYIKYLIVIAFIGTFIGICVFVSEENINAIFELEKYDLKFEKLVIIFISISVYNLCSQIIKGFTRVFSSIVIQTALFYFGLTSIILLFDLNTVSELIDAMLYLTVFIAIISSTFLIILFYSKLKGVNNGLIEKSIIFSYEKENFYMIIVSVFTFSVSNFDILVLGTLVDKELLSIYTIASRTAFIVVIILSSINSILAPLVAQNYHRNNFKLVNKLSLTSSRISILAGVSAAFFIIIYFKEFATLFRIDSYSYLFPLIILLMAQIANASVGGVSIIMQMIGNEKILAIILVSVALVSLPIYLIATKILGLIGTALVTLIVQAIINFSLAYFLENRHNIRVIYRYHYLLLITYIIFVPIILLTNNSILAKILLTISLVIFVLFTADKRDLEFIGLRKKIEDVPI